MINMRYTITLSDQELARELRTWRINMVGPDGKIPTWDLVMKELLKRARLEDILK